MLNLDRVLYRHAAAVLLGTSAAMGRSSLSREWFDALCDVETRIKPMMDEVNANRAMSRALARKGRPR